MARTIRTLALTGTAAAALLGTAGTVHADTPEKATTVVQAAVDRAAGAPVTLPSGKTVHIRGLDTAAYRADAGHRTTIVQLAAGGVGSPIQQQPGYNPQQVHTQAGDGAALGTGAVLALVLGIVLFFGIKGGKVSKGWAFTSMALGIVLAGTFVGPLVTQLGGTGVTAFGNIFGGL
ncbi:hypothetical protein HW130_17285 [Streptomyces sp. PKU-EA00015]|uniref:hypothetical protein n=1 Tax=Streptomyces sp. PKU-EA00015 TaxID=2748326 RepID=UPI0015A15767|nr:hypothetical protein [Streptomyces sp. PKU-EA00015]NWF27998.1 hypothetical protein [Streptomyces sp. PKU-EA00015]